MRSAQVKKQKNVTRHQELKDIIEANLPVTCILGVSGNNLKRLGV